MDRGALLQEIAELHAEYVDALDEGPLERWPELFCEECEYRVTSRENHDRGMPLSLLFCESRAGLRDRVMAIRSTSVFRPRAMRHLSGAPRIVDDGAAGGDVRCRAGFAVFETVLGEETRVFLTGTYLDRLTRRDGVLRFRERVCVYDSALVPGSLVLPI